MDQSIIKGFIIYGDIVKSDAAPRPAEAGLINSLMARRASYRDLIIHDHAVNCHLS